VLDKIVVCFVELTDIMKWEAYTPFATPTPRSSARAPPRCDPSRSSRPSCAVARASPHATMLLSGGARILKLGIPMCEKKIQYMVA